MKKFFMVSTFMVLAFSSIIFSAQDEYYQRKIVAHVDFRGCDSDVFSKGLGEKQRKCLDALLNQEYRGEALVRCFFGSKEDPNYDRVRRYVEQQGKGETVKLYDVMALLENARPEAKSRYFSSRGVEFPIPDDDQEYGAIELYCHGADLLKKDAFREINMEYSNYMCGLSKEFSLDGFITRQK